MRLFSLKTAARGAATCAMLTVLVAGHGMARASDAEDVAVVESHVDVSAASQPAEEADSTPADPQAQAVLDAVIERYRGLKTYRDRFHCEARLVTAEGEAPEVGYLDGTLLFKAPDRLVSKTDAMHVQVAGDEITHLLREMRQYMVNRGTVALRGLAPGGQMTYGTTVMAVHPLAALLIDHDMSVQEALGIAKATGVADETRDGVRGRVLSGELRLPDFPDGGMMPFTAFIGAETGLFEEVRIDATAVYQAAVKLQAEGDELEDAERAEVVITFTEIETDGDVAADALVVDLDNARKVEMFGSRPAAAVSPLQLLGQPAPELAGRTLTGERFDLAEQRGRVVAVVFWGTWAPGAATLLADLQEIAAANVEQPVTVVGVNRNAGGNERAILDFVNGLKVGFCQLLDPEGGIAERWRVAALPVVLLVDMQGEIAEVHAAWSATTRASIAQQIGKLLRSEKLYAADEISKRRSSAQDAGQDAGLALTLSADAEAKMRLEVAETQAVQGSRWNMNEQDIDGDGVPELIMPDWQGGIAIVNPVTCSVKEVRLRNFERVSVQSVRGVKIDGDVCWLCAGAKYSMVPGTSSGKQQPVVRLSSPDGEVLWTFKPDVSGDLSAQATASAGDIDGDGEVEYVIGLTTYRQVPRGENSYTWADMKGSLIVLDQRGEVIVQQELSQQVELIYIPTMPPGQAAPLLCFAGGQLERYVLKPTEEE